MNPDQDYRFVFDLAGDTLTGAVFEIDGQSALATVSATDSAIHYGVAGLMAISGNQITAADATFDNFSAIDELSAIPEPSTLAFAGLFAGGLLFARRFFAM